MGNLFAFAGCALAAVYGASRSDRARQEAGRKNLESIGYATGSLIFAACAVMFFYCLVR